MNAIGRKHWSTKAKIAKEWIDVVYYLTLGKLPQEPLKKARVILTRFSSRAPDFDGLTSSFKHPLDGLVRAKILKNDSMDVIGKPEYNWVKCKQKEQRIEIEVFSEEGMD